MIGRVLMLLAEVFIGLLLAGVVVGAVVPAMHGAIGPGAATLVAGAIVVFVIVIGEAFRRRPSRP